MILAFLSADCISEKFDLIEKELAPILPKLSFMTALSESVAVNIPTRDVIPIAIINMVRTERNLLLCIDLIETLKFSLSKGFMPGKEKLPLIKEAIFRFYSLIEV